MDNIVDNIIDINDSCTSKFSAKNKLLRIVVVIGVLKPLDYFLEQFIYTYKKLGHEVFVVCIGEAIAWEKFAGFINAGVDFVVSFNNVAFMIEVNGTNIVDLISGKMVNIIVDNPVFTLNAMKIFADRNNVIEYCVDNNHVKYLENYPGLNWKKDFMPHGGVALERAIKPLRERNIDVLYVGATKEYPSEGSDIAMHCQDEMIENPNKDSYTAIRDAITMYYGPNAFDMLQISDIDQLQYYELVALGIYRTAIIKSLVENGVRVTVYGPGWENVEYYDNPNLIKMGTTSPQECIELMYDAKIVLNSMPWFKDGTHERVFNAMLAGAIAVSDKSKWFEDNFVDGKEMVLFDLFDMDDMVRRVQDILANPENYQDIANSGREKALAGHTWQHRAIQVLENFL